MTEKYYDHFFQHGPTPFEKMVARLPYPAEVVRGVFNALIQVQKKRHKRGLYYVDLSDEDMVRELVLTSGHSPDVVVDIVRVIMEVSEEEWPDCAARGQDVEYH